MKISLSYQQLDLSVLRAEIAKNLGSEYYPPDAVLGFLHNALSNYRGSTISPHTLCLAVKMRMEIEPAPTSEIQSSFAPFLGDLWNLQVEELIRLCPITELRQIGSENLARRFFRYALSVSTYKDDFLLAATRLKACFGYDRADNIFSEQRFLIESSGDPERNEPRLAQLTLLQLACHLGSSKTIGRMLADSIFRRNSGIPGLQDDDLVASLHYLSPWDLSDFVTSIFQEVYQSTDSEELTRFQNIIETLAINGADLTVIKPPWGRIEDFEGALLRYLEVLLIERTEHGLNELEVARLNCIEQKTSFLRFIKPILHFEQFRESFSEECLAYLREIDVETFKKEPLEILYPISEELISRGLIRILDQHSEFALPFRLLTTSGRAAALASVGLISLISDKARKGEDYVAQRDLLRQVWKHATWDEDSAIFLKIALRGLERVNLVEFIEKDLAELLFFSVYSLAQGIPLATAGIDEVLKPMEGTIARLAVCLSRINRAEPKNLTDYFRVIYEPIIQKTLREKNSITPIVSRISEKPLHKSERLSALGDIFSDSLENDTDKDGNLNLILDALKNLSPTNLVIVLDNSRLRDRLDARLQFTQRALLTRLNSLLKKYQNTLTQVKDSDDGA